MATLADCLGFVNDQILHYTEQLKNSKLRHRSLVERLLKSHQDLKEFLEASGDGVNPPAKPSSDYISVTPEDIEGLPTELLGELSLSESDHAEFDLVNVLKKHGGVMSLDHLIIALYKQTGEIHKRKVLMAKLYRMANKGMVYNVPNKRATYSAYPVEGAEESANQEDLPI